MQSWRYFYCCGVAMNTTNPPTTVLILCFLFVFFSFLALYGKHLHGDDHCCQIKVYIYTREKIANPNAE